MEINFYLFDKKNNSTKRPTNISATIEGDLKDECSIINPVIAINWTRRDIEPPYNYASIPVFSNRYYFISNWVFSDGLWNAYMEEDYLASLKSVINASYQYVTRSSSEYDGYLTDTYFPLSGKSTKTSTYFAEGGFSFGGRAGLNYSDLANKTLYNGRFVVSVNNGGDSDSATVSAYYELDGGGMRTFLHGIFDYQPTGFGSIGSGLAKQLANPIQYINHIYWYPSYVCPVTTPITFVDIQLGFYTIRNVSGRVVDPLTAARSECGGLLAVPKHPFAIHNARKYCNLSPRSNYTLWLDPFGSLVIDSTKIIDSDTISVVWFNDISTGTGDLYVTSNEGGVILKQRAKTGIEFSITQNVTDYATVLTSGMREANKLISGNVLGTASGITNSVLDALAPQSSTVGGSGGFTIWSTLAPRLQAQFFQDAQGDSAQFGSPLCKTMKLSDLSGFCKCENAKVSANWPLSDEISAVENLLNNGVYLE